MDASRRLFYGSWVLLFTTGTAVVWGEAIGLALFIDRLGIRALPLGFLMEAVLSTIFIINIERIRDMLPEGVIVAFICLGGVGILAIGWLVVENGSELGFGLYYAAQRIMRDLLLYYTWNYVASFYSTGSRYLLPRMAMLSRIGVVFSGIGLFLLTLAYNVEQLVWLWGGTLLAGIFAVGIFADEFSALPRYKITSASIASVTTAKIGTAVRSLWNSELMRYLSVGAFLMMFVLSLVFYQILDTFRTEFPDAESLLRWLSVVSVITSLVIIPVQYRLLPRILQRSNAAKYAEVYPTIVGTAFAGVMILPMLGIALLAEIARTSLQASLYDTLHNQMKSTLPASVTSWAHTFLEGVIEPAGRFLAAGVLTVFVLGAISDEVLLAVGFAASLLFLYSQHLAGKLYTETLNRAISAGQYGFLRANAQEQIIANQEVEQKLISRLKKTASDDRDILLITEALAEAGSEFGFEAILRRWPACPAGIQAELLRLLIEGWPRYRRSQAVQVVVVEALHSEASELRRAALKAMLASPGLFDTYAVAEYLIHQDPTISTLAAQLLLQHPSKKLAKAAQAQLNWLSHAASPSTRALAITSLVQGGINRFGERVVPLEVDRFQSDPSARVRMAVVTGAEGNALLHSVQDVSPSVRQLAIQKMSKSRRRSTTLLLHALEEIQPQLYSPPQIVGLIRYWYLLTALANVNPRKGYEKILPEIERGLQQIDYLTSLRRILSEMEHPPVAPILGQLNSDRAQLIQAFLDSLTAIFGKATFAPIARTLQMQPDSDEAQTMLSLLGEMTTSETARKLHLLLTRSKNDDLYVTSDIAHRAKNPAESIQDLLRQEDEWRPLLVLYALSALPRVLFQALAPDELVETILEKSRQSNQDTIRESARLIRQALKEDFAAFRADSALSRISPTHKDSNAMLSTIERMLFLRNVSFFENLRLDQLRTLARICDELAVNQGDYILHKGEAGDSLFVVVEGRIKIVDPGSENVLAVLSSGEVLGEISLFDGGVRSADAVAETTTLLLVVNRDALDDALADDPGIALDMLRVMALRIRESNKTLSRMSQKMNVSEIRQELQEIRKEMNEI